MSRLRAIVAWLGGWMVIAAYCLLTIYYSAEIGASP